MESDARDTTVMAAATTAPLALLVRLIGVRLGVMVWGLTVVLFQGTVLAALVWLSAMQRLWHVPVIAYTYIATAELLLNVLGLVVFAVLWFRAEPADVPGPP